MGLKVAFVVGNFPSISQTFILNQIAGLMELGHQVDIFSFDKGEPGKLHPIVEKYDLLSRTTYLWDAKHSWRYRFLHGDPVFWKFFFKSPKAAISSINFFKFGRKALSLSLLYQADHLAGKGPYDVIHCQFGTFGLQFLPIHELGILGGKLIVQFRGYDISQFVQENGKDVYKKLFSKTDYFLTNCDFFKRKLVSMGCQEKKVSVVYSGIDCARFAFAERHKPVSGPVKIAMIGRLVEKKGIEYAVEALSKLIKNGKNLEFLLIGDGPMETAIREKCHTLGIANRVYFLGAKNQDQIIEILKDCHLFIAPSVTAKTGDQDAPVNVLKEAMAMGMPVVSTLHGGIPELVQDGISGFLVPERDSEALAQKLGELIEHPEKWPQMGRAGRAFVEEHFETKKLNKLLAGIYTRTISK